MNKQAFFNKRRFALVLGVLLVLLAASATMAFAQTAATGDGSISACVLKDGSLYITSTATCKRAETLLTWNIVGPQGPQGEPGPQGDAGPQGPEGPAGQDGATGPQGTQGPAGADGLSAYDLAKGSGFLGSVEQWLASLVGPKGDRGEAGPQGPQGEHGLQGEAGPAGATGLQGPQGPVGATGPQGVAGQDGAPGAAGATGAQGDPGLACWDLNGNGAPDTVEIGSGFTEDMNHDGKVDVLDCKGDQGEAGPQGPAGPTGPQGPQGPTGPQGEPGPAGTGIAGLDDLDGIPCRVGQLGQGVITLTYDPVTDEAKMHCAAVTSYTLTVVLNVTGDGTYAVSSDPAGIECATYGGVCSFSFPAGRTILLTDSAEDGSFTGWAGACNGTGSCQVVMDGDKTVTAEFATPEYPTTEVINLFLLNPSTNLPPPYEINGSVMVTTNGGQSTCEPGPYPETNCGLYYVESGESITFEAIVNNLWSRFDHWEGMCFGETSNTCTLTFPSVDGYVVDVYAMFTAQ